MDLSGRGDAPNQNQCSSVLRPGAAAARLLTRVQYDNTLRDLIGDEGARASAFPPENTLLGFSNNADAHTTSLVLVEEHVQAAEEAAAALMAKGVDELLPCPTGDRSLACVETFVTELGSRAFRRPISDAERAPLLELFTQAEESWGFDKGLELVIVGILQSPQLLYRLETEPGTQVAEGVVQLDGYQIASRLSYLLWNTMPDDELLALASSRALEDVTVVEQQARRMLDDPRARSTVEDFHQQWLGLARFGEIARQGDSPQEAIDLRATWRASVERFVEHAFWEAGGNVDALLGSPMVFADAAMAELYGLSVDAAAPSELVGVVDDTRAGILTQPGMMALLAHSNQSAPVQRGLFVREQLLCHELPPPPPDVNTSPPDPDPNATTRERFREHSANERCATCHQLLDPVGFGLENFDQLGRYRTEENGIPVDASGNLLVMADAELSGPFDGALELVARLNESDQVRDCLATQWFRYGMGRAESREDNCSLGEIKDAFARSNGDFKSLLVALTQTDVFRYRTAHEQDL